MIGGYRVVSVCPAGRRRYVELLAKYLLRERGLIDRHEWWVNTFVPDDIQCLHEVTARAPDFFKLVTIPAERTHIMVRRIGGFFPGCVDPKTIYLRVDDDIVYVAPTAIRQLLEFRVKYPDPFLVYPSIVNNAWMSHIHQGQGAFGREFGNCGDQPFGLGWSSGELGELAHRSFLDALEKGDTRAWTFEDRRISSYDLVPINCVVWFGRDLAAIEGRVGRSEENFLSCVRPADLRRPNVIHGSAVMAHFSYWRQRPHLDYTDVLGRYGALAGRK